MNSMNNLDVKTIPFCLAQKRILFSPNFYNFSFYYD